jgi:hypothetical protein
MLFGWNCALCGKQQSGRVQIKLKDGRTTVGAGASVMEMSVASGAGMPLTVSGWEFGFSVPGICCGAVCSDMIVV